MNLIVTADAMAIFLRSVSNAARITDAKLTGSRSRLMVIFQSRLMLSLRDVYFSDPRDASDGWERSDMNGATSAGTVSTFRFGVSPPPVVESLNTPLVLALPPSYERWENGSTLDDLSVDTLDASSGSASVIAAIRRM